MPSLPELQLSAEDRRALLLYARESVQSAVLRSATPEVPKREAFGIACGVFVTVHVQGKLRGCIGVVETSEPLSASIVHCASGAALRDPRFPPVSEEELGAVEVELSLLSRPAPRLVSEIELGKHGLIVTKAGRRGLLLPQVAVEHKLSREQFLAETCRKAGLAGDAWRTDDVAILGFTCVVISDSEESRRGE
jgi:AmmeMemoRadiSam system protein A